MWDHGGQWDGGFGGDETSKGNGLADNSELPEESVLTAYSSLNKVVDSGWDNFLGTWFGTVENNSEAPELELLEGRNLNNPNTNNPTEVDFRVAGNDLDGVYTETLRITAMLDDSGSSP
jgi:hypothetical protein